MGIVELGRKLITSGAIPQIADFIEALAALAWPVFAAVAVVIFKKDISRLIGRLKKGKVFGQELELGPEVVDLQHTIAKANEEVNAIDTRTIQNEEKYARTDSDTEEILKMAERDPELAIMKLSALIEKEVRIEFALRGQVDSHKSRIPINRYFEQLFHSETIPSSARESLQKFWKLRNEVVHGHIATDHRDILALLDTGISLLRLIRSIPHEFNIVDHPGVNVYSDDECTIQIKGVKGLILETRTEKGTFVQKRVFPTSKADYYQKGKRVTWEWNSEMKWEQAFYIDPDSNQKKQAWGGAMEFSGRHLDDV